MMIERSDAALDGLKNPLRVGETLSINFCSNFVFIKQNGGVQGVIIAIHDIYMKFNV